MLCADHRAVEGSVGNLPSCPILGHGDGCSDHGTLGDISVDTEVTHRAIDILGEGEQDRRCVVHTGSTPYLCILEATVIGAGDDDVSGIVACD